MSRIKRTLFKKRLITLILDNGEQIEVPTALLDPYVIELSDDFKIRHKKSYIEFESSEDEDGREYIRTTILDGSEFPPEMSSDSNDGCGEFEWEFSDEAPWELT